MSREQGSLFEDKIEFEYLESVIGSGYETKVADLAIRDKLVKNKVINVQETKFLKSEVLASVFNKDTYFGDCENCHDMCGIK